MVDEAALQGTNAGGGWTAKDKPSEAAPEV